MSGSTPSVADALVRLWVRGYTSGLPAEIRAERLREIDSDLWEHTADACASNLSPASAALQTLSRLVRGVAADLDWRTTARQRSSASHLGDTMTKSQLISARTTGFLIAVVAAASLGWVFIVAGLGLIGRGAVYPAVTVPLFLSGPLLALYWSRCERPAARRSLLAIPIGGAAIGFAFLAAMIALSWSLRVEPWWFPWVAIAGTILVGGGLLLFAVVNLQEQALPRGNALPLTLVVLAASVWLLPAGPESGYWKSLAWLAAAAFAIAWAMLLYVIWSDERLAGGDAETAQA